MQESNTKNIVIGILIVIALCCICVVAFGVGGYVYLRRALLNNPGIVAPYLAPPAALETPVAVTRPPTDETPTTTLDMLKQTIVPENDPRELSCRLKGICDIPETMTPPVAPRTVGETDQFWVLNSDTNRHSQVTAKLYYVTDHAYFWVQEGVSFDDGEMKDMMNAFEEKIYPTDREFFGSEWTPGIDGDPHIYILYTRGMGMFVAGYFSSADEMHPLAHEYSNAHEMFLFNADNTSLSDEFTYGVLAHEFQHMIHWVQDRNEAIWVNEGFADLAMHLNGYTIGGHDQIYVLNPDIQLNDWPVDQDEQTPHYGSSFLFFDYFLNRFGNEATQALVHEQANGLEGVDVVLKQINATDAITGQPIQTEDLFMDWAVTNFLLDKNAADGRYYYANYDEAYRAFAGETIYDCPKDSQTYDVHQYGVDYIEIDCAGDHTVKFTGSTIASLLPVKPYSGSYAFWSNKGDSSDMTLTREFDLSNASAPITLSFQMWYDLETEYDYVYMEVSEDGEHWQLVTTPSGTGENPTGGSYGWGYNGQTNDWKQEDVDLSQYAGKKIFVRFEYVTDLALNGEGFLLDDVSLDAINYKSGFEADDGGWQASGFVRVQNDLPQTFRLTLIKKGSNATTVDVIPVGADQTAEFDISLQNGETAVLVVSGTTRYTRSRAGYQIEIK